MKFVVGITGGIGSGKSAAAEEFARLGATVVDTDLIARELTETGGAALPHIKSLFGAAFITQHGAMDRDAMRKHVFSDPAAKQALEELLHPMIRAEADRRIAGSTGPYVIYVVPLLIESGGQRDRVQRILVVDAPEDLQVERVRTRSGLSDKEIRSIIAQQAARQARLAVADDVIENSGSLDALRKQVAALDARYRKMAISAKS
ncbi:MAG TPA: dephospho-CoA kinase [Burkholderiales bacterium]|nr:dephospho-CoA kinase [Burkholderiales bacterium]